MMMTDELLNPIDERCAEVRGLMLGTGERELTELEALRVERHVDGCAACLRVLEGRAGLAAQQDRLVRSEPIPQPTEADWEQVDAGIAEELGLPGFGGTRDAGTAPAVPTASAPISVSEPPAPGTRSLADSGGWGRVLLPVAAAILLTALVVHNLSKPSDNDGESPSRVAVIELPAIEVHNLDSDQSSEIYLGDDEDDDGAVVFITTDEE